MERKLADRLTALRAISRKLAAYGRTAERIEIRNALVREIKWLVKGR
jgi:hypothetical protein